MEFAPWRVDPLSRFGGPPALRRPNPRNARQVQATAEPMNRERALHGGDESPSESSIERRLAARIGAARYRMWFDESARLRISGTELHVAAPSRFAADWIERHFRDDLATVAAILVRVQ